MVPSDPVKRFYALQAPFYDWTRWAFLFRRKQAIRRLALQPSDHVLEVGCGTGLNFPFLLDYLSPDQGGRLVGLDYSSDMLKRANRRIQRKGWPGVEVHCGNATEKLPEGPFDAILFAYSLSMIPEWEKALSQAIEVLRVGGRMVVLDFGDFARWSIPARVIRYWLRINHVATGREYGSVLSRSLEPFESEYFLGRYGMVLSGTKM